MTWLSPEDREWNKQMEASRTANYDRANGKFTQVSVQPHYSGARYVGPVKIPLPRPMTDREAYEYVATIGHTRDGERGFYDAQGSWYEKRL